MDEEAVDGEAEYLLTRAEAQIAGAFALMSAHGLACCASQRTQLEDRIVACLAALTLQTTLSAPFRAALSSVLGHWQAVQGTRAGWGPRQSPGSLAVSPSLLQ